MSMFKWPAYPKNETEFETLMRAIDERLSREGLAPFQRPMHVALKLWEAVRWKGATFPPAALVHQPGFEGDVLLAKAYRWYVQIYGERLKSDFAYGHVPERLASGLWRVRAPVVYGKVRFFVDPDLSNRGAQLSTPDGPGASLNVLTQVEDLPQAHAARMTPAELNDFLQRFVFLHTNLQWREQLPRTELLNMARYDFDESTAGVLGRRYGQARWAAQQAVEKTMKGLLTLGGTEFSRKGRDGHDLHKLADLLGERHGIKIAPGLLSMASCSPRIRYGAESTENQALEANHAVLGVLEQLRTNGNTAPLLASAGAPPL